MKYLISAKKFFNYLRLVGKVIAIWPLKLDATRTEILIDRIKWSLAFLNASGLLLPLMLGAYYYRSDSITMTKTLSELTALCEVFINLIQCRMKKKYFQVVFYWSMIYSLFIIIHL